MRIPFYQVDAFTSDLFSGNPAGICLLDEWLDDRQLQAISAENNLPETAFLLRCDKGFEIRWFTPLTEVALCGHATLASAFIIFNLLNWPGDLIKFITRESGELTVTRKGRLLEMDFPARPISIKNPPERLSTALNKTPQEIFGSVDDLLVVFENENDVLELKPDLAILANLEERGVITTAPGSRCDFVSRFFAPKVGIPEDPVTGSAHCVLVPYWSKRLGKTHLHARQVSKRGGELFCEDRGNRVIIAGEAILYLKGTIQFDKISQ